MKKTSELRSLSLLAGVTLLLLPACFAQAPQTGPALPDGGTRERLVSIFIPALPNSPFTATVNTEWVRPLPDGARITLRNHRLIARDKTGRIFQERRMLVPDNGKQQSVLNQIEIADSVLHQQYICMPREHVCQLEFQGQFQAAVQPMGKAAQNNPGAENLGTQSIAGVETFGTREAVVIPTGEIGNDSPITTKREFWYSPKLGLNMISVRDDPRFGMQRFELSDVTLGEPDPKLFAPPEGSKIIDLRAPAELEAPKNPPAN